MNGYTVYQHNKSCPCQRCRVHGLWGPAMLVTIGVLFLLDNMRILRFDHSWPLILILVGILKFAQSSASAYGHVSPYGNYPAASPGPPIAQGGNPQNDVRSSSSDLSSNPSSDLGR